MRLDINLRRIQIHELFWKHGNIVMFITYGGRIICAHK